MNVFIVTFEQISWFSIVFVLDFKNFCLFTETYLKINK